MQEPVGLAVGVGRGRRPDLRQVARRQVRPVDFVHLFFDLLVGPIPLLRREQTILAIAEGGVRPAMREGGKEVVTQEFVEPLGHGREGLQVGIVERPYRGMVEDLPIGLAEDQVDGVGQGAIGQPLSLKHDTVARKAGFEAPLAPVAVPVAQLGDDIGAGILVEGALEMLLLAATGIEAQLGGHLAQAPDVEHPRHRTWQGIEEPVDHQGIQFVGEAAQAGHSACWWRPPRGRRGRPGRWCAADGSRRGRGS